MTNSSHTKRSDSIDFLRAAAIVLVMIVHFPRLRQFFPFLNPWSGVDLFFAISGYVVAKSFVPHLDSAVSKTKTYQERLFVFATHTKAFFVRRFMRLTPALVFALFLYISLGSLLSEPMVTPFSSLISEIFSIFTYTANFYAGYHGNTALGWHWSLSAEEQFYFVFPFFVFLASNWNRRVGFTLTILALMAFILRPYGETWFGNAPAMMYLPQFRNDAIGYGFLVFAASQQSWFPTLTPKLFATSALLRFFTILVLVLVVALAPQLALSFNVAIVTIGIASAILVFLAVGYEGDNFLGVTWFNSALRWIGLRSYGLYLFHIPVVRMTQHIESLVMGSEAKLSYPLHFLFVILSLVGIVEFSYRFIEMPSMEKGKKWSKEILG